MIIAKDSNIVFVDLSVFSELNFLFNYWSAEDVKECVCWAYSVCSEKTIAQLLAVCALLPVQQQTRVLVARWATEWGNTTDCQGSISAH